jgi:hypothetical protein
MASSQMAVLLIMLIVGSCLLTFCAKFDTHALFSPLRHQNYDALCKCQLIVCKDCIRLNGCSEVSLTEDKQVHVQTCLRSPIIRIRKLRLDTYSSSGFVIPIIILYCCRIKWRHQYLKILSLLTFFFFFFFQCHHMSVMDFVVSLLVVAKCNRLLRLGHPWGAVTLSRWSGWGYMNMEYQEGP